MEVKINESKVIADNISYGNFCLLETVNSSGYKNQRILFRVMPMSHQTGVKYICKPKKDDDMMVSFIDVPEEIETLEQTFCLFVDIVENELIYVEALCPVQRLKQTPYLELRKVY